MPWRGLLPPRLVTRLLDLFVIAPLARRRYLVGPLPPTGPLLVVANQLSRFDQIVVGAALTAAGRTPRFFGHLAPDRRADAMRAALRRGQSVVCFGPDPSIGVLAGELGVPVAPVAQWGAQHLLAVRLFPPRRAKVVVTSLPVLAPPVEVGDVMAAIDTTVRRVAAVLDPPVSAAS